MEVYVGYSACFFRQAARTAQNTRDSSVSSAAAEREVRAMGSRAPTSAPQVTAWAWGSQLFTRGLAVERSGAMMPSNPPPE